VDWGDGSVTPAEIDEGSGTVTATHSYVSPGDYLIQLVVTDDDWGFGSANARLLVYDAAGAVDTVIGSVDALLTTLTDPAAVRDLGRVRDDLDGQISGLASDGAIDKLNSEDWVAALVKIEQALARIEAFETAYRFDLSAEKILLATAARSVAQGAFNNALAFIGLTPTHAQQEELDKINNWIAKGITALTGELYQESVRSFRFATARAVDVLE
jgi:cob(I)alamin adenosyltransferase